MRVLDKRVNLIIVSDIKGNWNTKIIRKPINKEKPAKLLRSLLARRTKEIAKTSIGIDR